MNKYEILFMLENELSDDKKSKIIDKITKVIEKNDGEIVMLDKWGTKRLAYEIDHKREAYYFLMNIECGADLPQEITRQVNIIEGAIRCMIVRKEKFDEPKAKKAPKVVEEAVSEVKAEEVQAEAVSEEK